MEDRKQNIAAGARATHNKHLYYSKVLSINFREHFLKNYPTEKQDLDTGLIQPELAKYSFTDKQEFVGYKQKVYESRFLEEFRQRGKR